MSFEVYDHAGRPLCKSDVPDGGYPPEILRSMREAGYRVVRGRSAEEGEDGYGQLRLPER